MNDFVDFAGRMVWRDMTDKDGNQLLDATGNHADMKCLTLVNTKVGM